MEKICRQHHKIRRFSDKVDVSKLNKFTLIIQRRHIVVLVISIDHPFPLKIRSRQLSFSRLIHKHTRNSKTNPPDIIQNSRHPQRKPQTGMVGIAFWRLEDFLSGSYLESTNFVWEMGAFHPTSILFSP